MSIKVPASTAIIAVSCFCLGLLVNFSGHSPSSVSRPALLLSHGQSTDRRRAAAGVGKVFPSTRRRPLGGKRLRILVTGGAGFVGSNLVDRLLRDGHYVIVADNFFTGRPENLQQWAGHPSFELVRHDVVEPLAVEVDRIYALACPASPPHYMFNKIKTIKTSVLGTQHALGLAKRVGARILLTSTSEVYGDPLVHPQSESYHGNVNILGPRSCYDEGKRLAETLMMSYREQEQVETRIARLFNTFGPRMHPMDGRVVSNFIIQALQGKPMTIYGDGAQTRSFQYIDDLVEGLVRLMESDEPLPVNLGNPDEYTIADFARIIRDKVGTDNPTGRLVDIVHLNATRDDPRKRRPDITKANHVLGWRPKVSVAEGLDRTIKYFKGELERLGEIEAVGPRAR